LFEGISLTTTAFEARYFSLAIAVLLATIMVTNENEKAITYPTSCIFQPHQGYIPNRITAKLLTKSAESSVK
jgi:hypothetical protein